MPEPAMQIRSIQAAHAAARPNDVGSFQSLTPRLQELSAALRESYQSSVATPILGVISKLRAGEAMSEADIGVVEGFMIGDAEAYTRIENDFESWIGELGRLVTSLADKSARLQGPLLLDAMGEVEDARRVLGDICNFLEQKERVARYKRTMAQPLDGARSAMLVEILQRQLASEEE